MTDELKPVAWMYELAGARSTNLDGSKSYTNWKSHITTVYPNVPVDGLRNLTPLYTADRIEALQQRVRELEDVLEIIAAQPRSMGIWLIASKALGDTHD